MDLKQYNYTTDMNHKVFFGLFLFLILAFSEVKASFTLDFSRFSPFYLWNTWSEDHSKRGLNLFDTSKL